MQILGDRIVIEPLDPTPADQIILPPDKSKVKSPIGLVRLRGTSPKLHPELVPGAKVFVDTRYGSQDTIHDGKPCRIVAGADVLLVINDD